ncbi:hypothetical protein DNI29_23130 [Hymenobacter sediminis]|uniref:hypothetical protein n=1 Tax=Hymenobacter sediminis TaxID=2218621 RepID=UPI000DA664E2|nr:hypothetical protein [Hymenobacter sediminis]RPD43756.1 hypothetical protein DNI29_23130 [Hymenobacter sediminis]
MYKYWCGAVLLGLVSSCKKDPLDTLPNATQSGKNTAGFLADGVAILPHDETGGYSLGSGAGGPVGGRWRKTRRGARILEVYLADRRRPRASWSFHLRGIVQPGTYVLEDEPALTLGDLTPPYMTYHNERVEAKPSFYSGPGYAGKVTITRFDTVQHIVAGTFEGRLIEDGGQRTVQITDGRFDVRFKRQ